MTHCYTTIPIKSTNPIIIWLAASAFMVFAMAVIGAITRLTGSGLSMVEWRPLMGAIPPMNAQEWERVFTLYQQSPEYQKINMGMSLEAFKNIFFWEWFHRLWGRMIGLVYALPLIVFWVKGMIPAGYKKIFIGLLFLGGAQGVMGWIMVQSGLVDRPSVSHYRLAAHLGLAYFIFGWLVWVIYSLTDRGHDPSSFCARRHGCVGLILLMITVVWGAFVAGKDAGLIYNTWPHMGQGADGLARIIPEDMWFLSPAWLNPLENPAAIQFVHRWIAVMALFFIGSFAWRCRDVALGLMVFAQVGLGIATLLSGVSVPFAAAHQGGAFILLALHLRMLHRHV